MDDETERLEAITTLNEDTQRQWFEEECARLEKTLRKGLCRTMWIISGVGMGVVLLAAVVLWSLTLKPVADIRSVIALQEQSAQATREQVAALESAAAKRDDIESLARKFSELENTQRATDGDASNLRKTMDDLSKTQNALMQMVAGLSTRVSKEEQARDRLTQAMESLGGRLDKR